MILNSQTLDELNVAVELEFKEALAAGANVSDNFADLVPVDQTTVKVNGLKQLGPLIEWKDEKFVHDIEEYNVEINLKEWERTFGIKRVDIETDKLGRYSGVAGDFGDEAAKIKDQRVAAALLAGTSTTGFDGKAIFATDHDLNPAGNQTNYSSSGMALTSGSVATVYETMIGYTGNSGTGIGVKPYALVVPPVLYVDALNAIKAQVTNGEENVVSRFGLQVFVLDELASEPTAWYMIGRKGRHNAVKFYQRKAPIFVQMTDPQSENVFMRAKYLYGFEASSEAALNHWFFIYKAKA